MPQLDFEKLPNSPYAVVQSEFDDSKYLLGKQFQQDERALQSQYLSDKQYQAKSAELNAHYNNLLNSQSNAARGRIGELNRIKSMVGKGQIESQAGFQAGWKMVLPQETYDARFPKQERVAQTSPITAPSLKSAATMMSGIIGEAEDKRGFEWGAPYKTQAGMIEKYIEWRAQSGYDYMEPLHQRQLDMRWDSLMKSDKIYRDWFSDEKKTKVNASARSLRLKTGRMGRAVQKKMGVPQGASPIGKSIINVNHGKTVVPVSGPTAEELKRQGGAKAFEQGRQLGYW